MTNGLFWLYWIAAFLGVVALLVIAAALQEWLIWRKVTRKRDQKR